jgi:hypothetical protein
MNIKSLQIFGYSKVWFVLHFQPQEIKTNKLSKDKPTIRSCLVTRRRNVKSHTHNPLCPSVRLCISETNNDRSKSSTKQLPMLDGKVEIFLRFVCYMHGCRSILTYFFIIYVVPTETKFSAVSKAPVEIHSARNHRSASQFFPVVMYKFYIISNDEKT